MPIAGGIEANLRIGQNIHMVNRMMQHSESAKYFANILGNVAVVGFGLALYQQKWWCLIIAIIAAKLGFYITWRLDK